jgi:hypothetical protein
MTDLSGLTREHCAIACNADGCAITGLSRCSHPLKGGLPIERMNDAASLAAFANACAAIGVGNYLAETESS